MLCQVQYQLHEIEKELMTIVYGCERFNMYTHGAETEVLLDH